MNTHRRDSHGHPFTAAAVVGSFSLALVVLLRVAGVFERSDSALGEMFLSRGFGMEAGAMQPWWDFLLVMAVVYALVWFLFETPGTVRRTLVLMTALVLLGAGSPVLALWGIFWSPVGVMLGAGWGGFCAILWARQHPMPCELPVPVVEKPERGKIVPLMREEPEEEGKGSGSRRNGSDGGNAQG